MRKVFWIVVFAGLGYVGFRYLKKDRTLESPNGLAKAFARALIRDDAAALDGYVQGEAKKDLPQICSQVKSLPRGPVDQFRVTSGGGAASSGVMTKNVDLFNDQMQLVMRISAFMTSTNKGWQIERLRATTY